MKNMTTTAATVAAIGAFRPSKYAHEGKPDRACVTFRTGTGNVEQWLDAPVVARLTVGATVTLVADGKGYSVADVQPAAHAALPTNASGPFPPAPALAATQRPPTKSKEEIREERSRYRRALVKEYAETFKAVCDEMQEYSLPDALLKDISTSIFIQTVRHFNL